MRQSINKNRAARMGVTLRAAFDMSGPMVWKVSPPSIHLKRTLLIALIAALAAGCSKQTSEVPKLQENTEAYFAAHGIVPGQVNELRIGGTLFRFPAGVGLNPYTAQAV